MARKERDRSNEVLSYQDRKPYINAATAAGIQTVFNRTRLSHQGWEARQLAGRLDGRQAWRNDARGSIDIFRDRRLPSPTKLDVHILVDSSGSMHGDRICRAQDMAGTLVDAFKRIPTVRVHVYQHYATHGVTTIHRVYEPGDSLDGLTKMLHNIAGGNADGFALEAVGLRAAQQKRPDTKSLVIMVSDGLPSVAGVGATGDILDHSTIVTQMLKRKGVDVMAVAIAGDKRAHERMYGEGSSVLFTGDWNQLNREFGAVFGKALSKSPTHR
jgi:cobalamin biosynthesis protein CobT